MAWGEQLETRTHMRTQTYTHTAEGSEGGFCLESSSVVLTHTLLNPAGSREPAAGQTDIAMLQGGLLSWRDEERAYASVKCYHPSLPLRAPGRKAEGMRPFQRRGEGGRQEKIEQDQFMIQLCV